jgi:2-(acetamidomethylene)succinate hydrolase
MPAGTSSNRAHSRRIGTGRITLNVREMGTGPLMMFFHGITSNSGVFEPLMARLADRFTTIAVDQRGHGLSDKPESGYEANDYGDDIAGLIRTFDQGQAILVGHSLGARNSVTAAAQYPELVRSVIAIDFTAYIETEVFDALESRVNAGTSFSGTGRRSKRTSPTAIRTFCRCHQGQGRNRISGCRWRAASTGIAFSNGADCQRPSRRLGACLPRRDEAVLIIRGETSKLVSAAALAKTSRLRPDLPVVVVPDTDHYVNEVSPEITLRAIMNFIDA